MDQFTSWFSAMDTSMQVFWACAIVGSFIFAIQMLLTLIGMDSTDTDVDFDSPDTMDLGGGISLFSIKNFINFIVGFGWGGVCLSSVISSRGLLTLCAIFVGMAFVFMFFLIKKQTRKLEQNGAFNINECIGKNVDVYLRIPARRNGKGKVQISFNGSVQELEAITDGEEIKSGSKVVVSEVLSGSTLLVQTHPDFPVLTKST